MEQSAKPRVGRKVDLGLAPALEEQPLDRIQALCPAVMVQHGNELAAALVREVAGLASRGRAVVAMGEAAPLVREALADLLPVIDAGSMREAVERGYDAARPDGVVLLAPACASFDWFRDYAERGRVFKEEVARLQQRGG